MLLGFDEALAWAREFLSGDELDAEFGPGAGDGDTMFCVRVSARAMRMLELWSSRIGVGKGTAVDRSLIEYLS